MSHKPASIAAVAISLLIAGCGTVYPRQANIDSMQSMRSEFDGKAGLADLRAAVAANEGALVKVASESREDAASAGPMKTGEQLDSNVLATEASYFLLKLPQDRQASPTIMQALGSSVAAFAESVSAEAVSVCNREGGPGGSKSRSCWEADLLFDAVRTAPLVDYLRDTASTNVAAFSGDDWRKLINTMSELEVVFEEEWTGQLGVLNEVSSVASAAQETQERMKYFVPYLCYADEALVTIATQGGALQTDDQRQLMMRFDAAGSAAVGKGAVLPGFSPKPETLASCEGDQVTGATRCRINANWAAVSRKCGAVRTCIAQTGDQSACIAQQVSASPES